MEAIILGIIALALCVFHIDTMAKLKEIEEILNSMEEDWQWKL